MDSLTQIVLGAAVGEVVLGSKTGNKAILYGAVAGTIPDLDVLMQNFTDTITATEAHRGLSHSIVFSILAAPVFGWLVNKLERGYNLGWRPWSWLFFWGLFTHPLLDCFTTWGTQLFWPFDLRIAFNSIFVIDPLYTIPFLICVIWAMCLNRKNVQRRRINRLGIIISSTYLMLTVVLKFIAMQQFKDQLEKLNIDYVDISTRPAAFNTVLWNANIETNEAYLIADYSFFDSKSITFVTYPKNRSKEPVFKSMKARIDLERLKIIADGWYLMEQKNNEWYFNDLRFGLIPISEEETQFVFSYVLDPMENGLEVTETEKKLDDAGLIFSQLWNRVQGN
jgi:inner membrane protein